MLRFLAMCTGGTIGWLLGFTLAFGPAQSILANPKYQSPKFPHVLTLTLTGLGIARSESVSSRRRLYSGV